MKLGDFIANTLTEIIDGVKKAQEFAKNNNATVNSVNLVYNESEGRYKIINNIRGDGEPTPIDFDILLTYGQNDKEKGKLGIFALPFSAGVEGENRDYSENASRVKFQVFFNYHANNRIRFQDISVFTLTRLIKTFSDPTKHIAFNI